jgi:hypothetical protein
MIKNISVDIVTRESQANQSRKARSPQKSPHRQLNLFNPPQQRSDDYPLKLELLPDNLQWWNETRYWLIHKDSGLRVPGSWSLEEAEELQDLSKNWNWNLDKERRVDCGLQLMALGESICKRSSLRKSGGVA